MPHGLPEDLPDENSKRFIAVLNRKVEMGRLMNALGHMTAGLAALVPAADLCLLEYRDASAGVHPNISHFPFIVLKADNSSQIRKVREEAIARGLPFTDFVDTMTVGTSAAQIEATSMKSADELDYYGVCVFGNTETLREFTKRFSLFK